MNKCKSLFYKLYVFCIDWGAGIWEYEGVAGVT